MPQTRRIEIFSAGCPICQEAVAQVRDRACPSCEVVVLDIGDGSVAARAKSLGIRSLPAVVIDGALADCCAGRGPEMKVLEAAGLGRPLS